MISRGGCQRYQETKGLRIDSETEFSRRKPRYANLFLGA
ncbi:hypothetical protein MC7420_1549 [Coleofasciculus chthonoplastes PCC 7420]|uniref:Uncharacterized protein n=1 Tax=Coleofasciculus chthonoplastes PCC 7420 TaxID=118168 RepID=B4W4V6_9CYAN|nr:hypothetical protein MC7420_1549 [Coleofasciculus chthonoplastes PCC 7420]